ncbi:Cyclic nucleotide-binding protein [Pseudocohnilembus persalinus]|uniref:Cyclic nucleotide-binding protein n=1 Tax=Pseudocohnilembus persalinus TaxID=266149 RepID=A0A0V0R082_PSEPJ|nr:Cyclic nucleotide-binding protein [Pseudocohnilembus persalinus]|eukprot:KRX07932.1 Cyclic nucleotide-binding protein [Pseudocohnilembus persalinus]
MKDSKDQQKVDVKQQQNETENQLQQKLLSSQNLFFIHKGKIEIYGKLQKVSVDNVMEQQMDIEAEEFIIGDIKDGDILGYYSFITQQSRNVSARAASISQVLQLNRDAFLSIIKKYPIDYALNCLSCGFNGHTSVECPRMIVKNLVSHNFLNSLLYREKEEELSIFQRRNSDCTVLRRGFQFQNQSQKNTQKSYYSIVSQNTLGSKSYKKMRKRRKSLRKFYINFSMGKINSLFYKEIIRKKVKVYREKYVKYQQQFSQTWEEQEENQTFYNEILKNLIAQNDKTVNILDKESVINSNRKRSKGKKQSYHIQFQEVHEESEENEEDEDFYTSNNSSSILEDDDYSSGLRIKDEDKQFLQNTASIKILIKDQVTLFFLQYYRIKITNNIYSFKDYQTYKILDFTQDLKSTMRWPTLTQNTQPYLIIDKGGNITQSQVEVIDRRLTQQFTGLSQKKNSYFQKQQRKEGSRSSLIDINELNATSNDAANKRNGKVRNMSLQISNLNSIQPKSKRNTILSDFDMSRQSIRNSQFQQLPPFGSLSNRNINTSFEDQIDRPQFVDQNLSQLMQLHTTNRHSQQLQSNNQVQQAIDENEEILKSSTGGDFSEIYNYQQMKLQHLNLQKQNSQHQSQSQYNQNTHITQGTENNNNNNNSQTHSYQDINLQKNASYKRKSSAKVKSVWTNDNEEETTENYDNYYNPNNYGLVSSRSTFVTMNSNLKNQHLQLLDEIRKKKVSKELYFYDFETFYDTALVEKQFQRFTGKAFQKSIYFPQNDIHQVIDEFVKYMGKKHKKEVFKKQIFVNDQNLIKILKKNQVEIDFIKQIYKQQKDPSQDSKIFIPSKMQFLVETLYNREKKYIKKIFTSKSYKSILRDQSQSQLSQTQRNQLRQTPTTQSFQQINQIVSFEQHKVNSKNSHLENFILSKVSNDHNQILTKQNNGSNEKAVQE